MAEKEFNPSILENFTITACPLKDSANCQTIFNLINKEEIDAGAAEDDAFIESQSFEKRHYSGFKENRSNSRNNEIASKSPLPYRRNSCLKKKIHGSRLKKPYFDRQRNESLDEINFPRSRSLGAVKPGRSFRRCNSRMDNSRASLFSETSLFSDNNEIGRAHVANSNSENEKTKENEDARKSSVAAVFDVTGDDDATESHREKKYARERTTELERLIENARESSLVEQISLPPVNSVSQEITDSDFTEGSRSTIVSDVKNELSNNQRRTKDKSMVKKNINAGDEIIDSAESEAEIVNISQTLSSELEFHRVTRVVSLESTKRKAGSFSPVERSTPKQQKLDTREKRNLKSLGISKITETNRSSPSNPGVEDLENRFNDVDSEQSSENSEIEISDRASFTLGTTALSNGYEDSWNRTSSNILSSSSMKITEETCNNLDNVSASGVDTENPLNFGANDAEMAASASADEENSETDEKENDKSSSVGKSTVEPCRNSTRKTLKEIEISRNNSSLSSKSKHNSSKVTERKTINSTELKLSTGQSLEQTEKNTVSLDLRSEEITEREMEKSITKTMKSKGDERPRRSARLRAVHPLESEDYEKLSAKAAKIAKKIQRAKENSALPRKTLKKLRSLVIKLRHQVLPQHEIESGAGTKALSYKQHKAFLRLAPLRRGTYTRAEDRTIKSNWNAFCRDHNWDPNEYSTFLNLKHGNKLIMSSLEERRKFVQFLADGLPNRPLCSVYSRFKNLYGKKPTWGSRYTRKEDMKILAYMLRESTEHPNRKCSELAKVLNRPRESIWKRYKKLKQKYPQKSEISSEEDVSTKVEWNLLLVEKFITTFLDVTLSEDVMELKDAFIPKAVWLKMEEKMKIDHQFMKRFWEHRLHLQLFAGGPLYLNEIKIKLIKHIYANKLFHSREIKWRDIVKDFDGLTISFLRKVFNHLTMKASLKLRTRDLKRILKWLHSKKIDQLMTQPLDKCLPRIFYKDRKAKLLEEEIEGTLSNAEND